jgi:hypothetical protein
LPLGANVVELDDPRLDGSLESGLEACLGIAEFRTVVLLVALVFFPLEAFFLAI